MTPESVLKILGVKNRQIQKSRWIYTLAIDSKHPALLKFNMPSAESKLTFSQGKLIEYSFHFWD
jgi:hypothetical protein